MSLLFGEKRSISFQDFWGSGGDVDTLGNSVEGALRLVPLYACVRLIADQFASAPLHAYREAKDGSRERLTQQPPLLTQPTPTGSMFDWKYRAITSLLLRGNAVGLAMSFDGLLKPKQVVWLNPDRCSVDDSGPTPVYYYEGRRLPREQVVHIPAFVLAGKTWGLSPLRMFMTTFETGHAAQALAKNTYSNNGIPAGKLRNTEKTITPEVAAAAKAKFREAVAGRDVFVTGADWDFDVIGLPADEARFIETIKMTATQVASIYGVRPEKVGGDSGSSLTYGNREQDAQDLVTETMLPWFTRFEEVVTGLLPLAEYAKFNVDAMVRADLKTRMEAHEIAQRIGLETNGEARRIEDRPPLSDDEKAEWLQIWKQPKENTPPSSRSHA